MRTSIVLDDDLVAEAQRITGAKTKREVVELALRDLVDRQKRLGILARRGRVRWEGDLELSYAEAWTAPAADEADLWDATLADGLQGEGVDATG